VSKYFPRCAAIPRRIAGTRSMPGRNSAYSMNERGPIAPIKAVDWALDSCTARRRGNRVGDVGAERRAGHRQLIRPALPPDVLRQRDDRDERRFGQLDHRSRDVAAIPSTIEESQYLAEEIVTRCHEDRRSYVYLNLQLADDSPDLHSMWPCQIATHEEP
jgi:hypothetical protein